MPAQKHKRTRVIEHILEYQKIYLVSLLLIILVSPYVIRYFEGNPTVIGEPSYFHLNAAEQISKYNFYQNPYHLLLSLNTIKNNFVYRAIPLILAVFSLLLLIALIKMFKFTPQNQFFFLLFLILSPTFVYTFTVLNHYSFFIFLNLLAFNLLLHKRKCLSCLSFPVFAVMPFFDVFSSILTLLLLAVYFYLKRDSKAKIIAGLIVIFTFFNVFLGKPFLLGPYASQNILADFIFVLGGFFGISLFAFLLAIAGLIATWKKEKFFLFYLFLSLFIAIYFYQTAVLVYFNFFIMLFASFGFVYFLNKEWQINIIKDTFLFLIILGLVFSTFTCLDKLSAAPPSPETKESLQWLKENTAAYKIIFSHPQDSYLIEYFSHRPAFIHYHEPDFKAKLDAANQIFQSTYIKETFPLLTQNDISHIYLSPKTKADLPPDRGLLFLFQNKRFKRIYNQNNIEIWQFKKAD